MMGWMLALLLSASTARAQSAATVVTEPFSATATECPFDRIQDSRATINTVTLDGTTYIVQTLPYRLGFEKALQNCNEYDAARYFSLWRQRRRWTNASLILAIPTAGVALIPAAWFGLKAGAYKELMLVALKPAQAM